MATTLFIMVITEREEIRRRWLLGESCAGIATALRVSMVHVLQALVGMKRAA